MKRPSTARGGEFAAALRRRARGSVRNAATRESGAVGLKLKLLLALLLLIGLAFLLRPLIFAAVARPLVVSSPFEEVDALLILDGDRRFDEAARLLREGAASRVLLAIGRRDRLVRAGLVPDPSTLTRRELVGRGGTETPIIELGAGGSPYTSDWDRARAVAGFLEQEPETTVAVLCPELSSRALKRIYDEVLGERAAQLFWLPLPDRRYDTRSWWRSRAGVLALVEGYAAWLQARFIGDGGSTGEVWEPGPWLAAQPGGRMPAPIPEPSVDELSESPVDERSVPQPPTAEPPAPEEGTTQ